MSERIESFRVEDGMLVRRVTPRRGEPYEHRCSLATYEAVGVPLAAAGAGVRGRHEVGCVVGRRRHAAAPFPVATNVPRSAFLKRASLPFFEISRITAA